MPISAEQWRATTGALNAGKGSLRSQSKIEPHSLFFLDDLPSPPPTDWKGYYIAMVLLCVPFLYKLYTVGMSVMMYLVSRQSWDTHCHGLTVASGHYVDTSLGLLTADVSGSVSILDADRSGILLFLLNAVFYVAMVMTVVLIGCHDYRERDNHHLRLTYQIRHLDLFWLNCGPDCEIIVDTNTGSMYATLLIDYEGPLQYDDLVCTQSKPKKNIFSAGYACLKSLSLQFILQMSTLVVAMLLLLAGDVERNPGPITVLDMKDHSLVCKYLKVMNETQLRELGGTLGIHYSKLEKMKHLPAEMVAAWLREEDYVVKTSGHPSWKSLINALRIKEIGQTGIADRIEREIPSVCSTRKRSRSSSLPKVMEIESTRNKDNLGDQKQEATAKGTASMAFTENGGSSEYSPSPSKKVRSFPYLEVSGEVDREALEAQLCEDFDKMTKTFQFLKHSIKESLKARGITVQQVIDCVSEFKTLEPVYTDLRAPSTPKFRHDFLELPEETSLDKAMTILSKYSSFFNFGLVEQITTLLGTEEDKEIFAKYEHEFEEYAKRIVYQCPHEIGYASENDWPSFLVKVHEEGFEECTISHLRQFLNKVANILHLPIGMLLLQSVIPGCIELALQVSPSVHRELFPLSHQQEADLAALGVVRISAGEYHYPPSNDEGSGSDHKDDTPDKGSDSGIGTFSSTTTIAELLECKKAIIEGHVTNPYVIEISLRSTTEKQPSTRKHSMWNETFTPEPLHVAAYYGRLNDVQKLIEEKKLSILEEDQFGNTPLHYAVEGHHLKVVKHLIEVQECNPTEFGAYDETPLHLAARLGHLDIVKYLISEQGVDPMYEDRENNITPLHSASIGGNLDVVCYLINEFKRFLNTKEIISDKGKMGLTPVHYAANYGQIATVKFFISDMNCDPNILGENGCTPLHAAAKGGHVKVMKYLIDDVKCNPSQSDMSSCTPLHYAARHGHMEAVKFLIFEKGCDPSCRDNDGTTPLHQAALGGRLVLLKFFITELNCDPNTPGIGGLTSLHAAAQQGHVHIVKYLIENANCNPSQLSDDKVTPLFNAAVNGQLEVAKFLTLEKHCDPTCRNSIGDTPIHTAAQYGHLKVLTFFISELNCDPNIPGDCNMTPLHVAAKTGQLDIIRYLIDIAKCNPSPEDFMKITPLHDAAYYGHLTAVKLLLTLNKDFNPMCRADSGITPLHFAAQQGHLDVVKYYMECLKYPPDIGSCLGTPLTMAANEGHQEIVHYLQAVLLVRSGINFYNNYFFNSIYSVGTPEVNSET